MAYDTIGKRPDNFTRRAWQGMGELNRQNYLAFEHGRVDNLAPGTTYGQLNSHQLAAIGAHSGNLPDIPVNPDTASPVGRVKTYYDSNPVLYSAILLGVVLVVGLKLQYRG